MGSTDTLQFFIKTEVDTSWQDENMETSSGLSSERKPDFMLLPQPISQSETSFLTDHQTDVDGHNKDETSAERPDTTVYNQLGLNVKAEDQNTVPYNTPSLEHNTPTSLSEGTTQAAGTVAELWNNPCGNESSEREVNFCNLVTENDPGQDAEVDCHSGIVAGSGNINIIQKIAEPHKPPSASTQTNICSNKDKQCHMGRFKRINNQSTTADCDTTHIIQGRGRPLQDSENVLPSGADSSHPDIPSTAGSHLPAVPVDTSAHLSPLTKFGSSGDTLLQKSTHASYLWETVTEERDTESNISHLRKTQMSQSTQGFCNTPLDACNLNLQEPQIGQIHGVRDNMNNITETQSLITQQNCKVKIECVPVISSWGSLPRLESGLLKNMKSDSLVSYFRTSAGESTHAIYATSKLAKEKATLTSILDKKSPMNPKKVDNSIIIGARQPNVNPLPDRNIRTEDCSAQFIQHSEQSKIKTLGTLLPKSSEQTNYVSDVTVTLSEFFYGKNKGTNNCSQAQPLQGSQKINMKTLRALCPKQMKQKSECDLYQQHFEENIQRLKPIQNGVCQGTHTELERDSENACPKFSSSISGITPGKGDSMQDYHIYSTSAQLLPGSQQYETLRTPGNNKDSSLSNSYQIIPSSSHINCDLSPEYDAVHTSKKSVNGFQKKKLHCTLNGHDGTFSAQLNQTGMDIQQGNVNTQLVTSLPNPMVLAGIDSSKDKDESTSLQSNSSLTKEMYKNNATISKTGYDTSIAHVRAVQTNQLPKMIGSVPSGLVSARKLADSNPALRELLYGKRAMLHVNDVKNDLHSEMATAKNNFGSKGPSKVNNTLSNLIPAGMLQRKGTKRPKTHAGLKNKRSRVENKTSLPDGKALSLDNGSGMITMGFIPNPTGQLQGENLMGLKNGVDNNAAQYSTVRLLETNFEKDPLDSVPNQTLPWLCEHKNTKSQNSVAQSSVLKNNPSLTGLLQGTDRNHNGDMINRDSQANVTFDCKRMGLVRSVEAAPAQTNPALLTVLTRESPAVISPDDTQDMIDDSTCASWSIACNDGLGNEKNGKQLKPFVKGLLQDQNVMNLNSDKSDVSQNNPALIGLLQSKSGTLKLGAFENEAEQSSPAVMEYDDAMKMKTDEAQNNRSLSGLLQGKNEMNLSCNLREKDSQSRPTLYVKSEHTVSTEKIVERVETRRNPCLTDVLQTHLPGDSQDVNLYSADHSASGRGGIKGDGTYMKTKQSSPKLTELLQRKSSAVCVPDTSLIRTNPALSELLMKPTTSVQNKNENAFLESRSSGLNLSPWLERSLIAQDRSLANPQTDFQHCLTLRTLDYYRDHTLYQADQVMPGSNIAQPVNNDAAEAPLLQRCNGQETMNNYGEKSLTHPGMITQSKMQCETMVNSVNDQRSIYAPLDRALPEVLSVTGLQKSGAIDEHLHFNAPGTKNIYDDYELNSNSVETEACYPENVAKAKVTGSNLAPIGLVTASGTMRLNNEISYNQSKGTQEHNPIVENDATNPCLAMPTTCTNSVALNSVGVVSTQPSSPKRTDSTAIRRENYVEKSATQTNPALMNLLQENVPLDTDMSHQAIYEHLQGNVVSDTIGDVDNTLVSSGDYKQEPLICKLEQNDNSVTVAYPSLNECRQGTLETTFYNDFTKQESLWLDSKGKYRVNPQRTFETDVELDHDSALRELQGEGGDGANHINVESAITESKKLKDIQFMKKRPEMDKNQRTTTKKCGKVLRVILKDVLLEYPNFQTVGRVQDSSNSSVVNRVPDDGGLSLHARDSLTLLSTRDGELKLENIDEHESQEVQMSIHTIKDQENLVTDKKTPVAIEYGQGTTNQECIVEKKLPATFQFTISPIHFWNVYVPPGLEKVDMYQMGTVDSTVRKPAKKGNVKFAGEAVNGSKSNVCSYCGFKSKSWSTLSNHIRIHTGEKPHECSICKRRFRQDGTLRRHLTTHTKEKPYKCNHCGLAFAFSSSLRDHERRHTGEKPYTCKYCGMKFGQRHEIAKHVLSHTGHKQYVCEHCGKVFINAKYFRKHKLYHTGHSMHVCDICGKTFPSISNLNRHKKRHTGERQFSCDICKKSFVRKDSLTDHIRVHMK